MDDTFKAMKNQYQITVEGMSCTSCAASVKKQLEKMGLQQIKVDYLTGDVVFESESEPDYKRIEEGLSALGYRLKSTDKDTPYHEVLKRYALIAGALTLPLLLPMFGIQGWITHPAVQAVLSTIVFGFGWYVYGKGAWESLRTGSPNMYVLILLGATAAWVYSLIGWYLGREDMIFFETTATIITLVIVGSWIEASAVFKTSQAIESLALQSVKKVKVLVGGRVEERDLDEVRPGDLVIVETGETIPVDGIIESGEAVADESLLTGESRPVPKRRGDKVYAGSILKSGSLQVTTLHTGEGTVLSQIVQSLRQARQNKSKVQKLADRISAIFVPTVLVIAALTWAINYFAVGTSMEQALLRAVATLVVACPCALGLATPTAVAVGLGKAATKGIIIKNGLIFERIPRIRKWFFDKTGTLTMSSDQQVHIEITPESPVDQSTLLQLIYTLESHSTHPIARAIAQSIKDATLLRDKVHDIQEIKGKGITATYEGTPIYIGKAEQNGTLPPNLVAIVKIGDQVAAKIYLDEVLRPGAKALMRYLRQKGIDVGLLSGDRTDRVEHIARTLQIEEWKAELTPDKKMEIIRSERKHHVVALTGDGINDAPALAEADVGISFGQASELAKYAGEVVIINERLDTLIHAHRISQKTYRVIRQNLFWAFFYNVLAIPIAAAGYLHPMMAALAMVFSDVIVVGNSLLLYYRK